ncbi:MAG: amidohydrolase [Bryobacterales bacterium]|nr:amidohydrolase [Bryobacterales bacterium]
MSAPDRREFLRRALAAGALATSAGAQPRALPIIDSHIHLFDPTRPQGVPWPSKKETVLYQPALPPRYRGVVRGLGVTGAVVVECSPWLEDNQWVLDVAAGDGIVVATVGNLEPGKPEFRRDLERFHKNPLFRGIRHGNLWRRDLTAALRQEAFLSDLRLLAQAGLSLDTADPDQRLLEDVVRLTDRVPGLRVIIDHLPLMPVPAEPGPRAAYDAALKELGGRPQVYVKVSGVLRGLGSRARLGLAAARATLDLIYETFGADRVLYGSDWPNSDPYGSYQQTLALVMEYFLGKGTETAEKYFWRTSFAAYRWVRREGSQPDPAGA